MNRRRFRLLTGALALLAGVVVFVTAHELFPYHTPNHDEGVYLQQAAMLLEGRLFLEPPVADAFRPWFFVDDGGRLYPKYAPVPAGMFAVGELLGGYRVALALVAAGNVGLATLLVAEAFDRRTGLLAGALLLASPLFLVDSSVFLPYAPTTFWNLLFAVAYVKAARAGAKREERRDETERPTGTASRGRAPAALARATYGYAALAGLAVGIAFFSRPYTAVLFAAPFIAHALYSLGTALGRERRAVRGALARLAPTAALGLAGVGVTLAYNAAVTGSPLLFPYEAFAPQDGLGFGYREILGYGRDYTPELALEANAKVVAMLFDQWVVAGPLGTALAVVGVGAFLWRARTRTSWRDRSADLTDAQVGAVLAGLFVSVIAGNVYFWGNLNILGDLADPNDGLIDTLGPYYHFDLLVPTAAFAAHATLLGFDRARARVARAGGARRQRAALAAVALVGTLLLAGAAGAALAGPVSETAEITDSYEVAYEPFEERDLSNAVVFVPTPYGDWLNHPFQHLRNDPGFDGEVVYALDGGPDSLEVVEAYPDRTYYRYVYRGEWTPFLGQTVDPALREIRAVRSDAVGVDAAVGIPSHADRVSVRLSTHAGTTYYAVNGTPERLPLDLRVSDDSARIAGPGVEPTGENRTVPVEDADEVVAEVLVSDAAGGGFSYRLELPIRHEDGAVVALSPYQEACLVPDECGGEAAYVDGAVSPSVFVESELYDPTNESEP
ncbi:hypothetical protein NGM10_01485 [Halorussus salilacus]|uniref:DUF7846 domain-containing protein n=1 Tax=Halorussus salilacus TaxID=2953750 RepID=UPI0020A022FD|nr:hypothetical protein [Halorussus salilacus]USZ68425.1 hypothetical protein NGM10_01485 [Halorussus salilacus]